MSAQLMKPKGAKVKTSVSLKREVLAQAQQLAQEDERSVSYILEKAIEAIIAHRIRDTGDAGGAQPPKKTNVNYSSKSSKSKKKP
jgi:hypothetical protein